MEASKQDEQRTTIAEPQGGTPPPAEVPGTPRVSPAEPVDDPEAKGRAATEAYARDHDGLTEENERDALDYLLAPKPARLYNVNVDYETEDGARRLTFVIRGTQGRKIDSIEQAAVSEATGRIDQITADLQLVAESVVKLVTLKRSVQLSDAEFLTVRVPGQEPQVLASPADALEARFGTQLGLISGVAREIRRVSGYDPSKVGQAQRRLVDAAGN